MSSQLFVESLHIYPIKSCAGIDAPEAFVGSRGLQIGKVRDRSWMIIDDSDVMVTQRTHPILVTAKVSIAHGLGSNSGALVVTAEGMPDMELDPSQATGSERLVEIHHKKTWAHFAAPGAHEWFSHLLNDHVRVVYQADEDERFCDTAFAHAGDLVGLADGYQALVTSRATLDKLNGHLDTPVTMGRFRPNIVVAGAEADAEYGWRRLAFGAAEMEIVKPCKRCSVIQVNPETGEVDRKEPLATLSKLYHLDAEINGQKIKGAIFGENANACSFGMVGRGDEIRVLATKPAYKFD